MAREKQLLLFDPLEDDATVTTYKRVFSICAEKHDDILKAAHGCFASLDFPTLDNPSVTVFIAGTATQEVHHAVEAVLRSWDIDGAYSIHSVHPLKIADANTEAA